MSNCPNHSIRPKFPYLKGFVGLVRQFIGGYVLKNLLSVALVATVVFGAAEADASYYYRHSPKCKVLTVEVTAESKLIIEGQGLTKWDRIPTVSFGGAEVPVDSDTLTAERIEADLSSVELAETPKDYLLEVKRSRWDYYGCRSHMVTVVPPPVEETNKIVFVTSSETDGKIGDLDAADGICNALAGTAGLTGTFVAYLSDSDQTNAISRLPEDGGPWVNTNGDLVAANREAIITESPESNFLENAIQFDEMGGDQMGAPVWTGTDEFGEASFSDCAAWTSLEGQGTPGLADKTNLQWVAGEGFFCAQTAHLYCFEN